MLIVLTTTSTAGEAESLAEKIVEAKLAACVQILPQLTSVYFWENAVRNNPESLMLIKTLDSKFEALSEFIRTNHTYDIPEIVAINAEKISESYLKWMSTSLI